VTHSFQTNRLADCVVETTVESQASEGLGTGL
jgi:hypothetical protein